jgi:aromatic-L-amino-acid decarboxylase
MTADLLPAPPSQLEFSGAEFERLVDSAMAHLRRFLDTLNEQNLEGTRDLATEHVFTAAEPMPGAGMDFDSLLDHLFDVAIPYSLNPAAPGFMGYVPGGGLLHAAVADLISNVINRYVGVAAVAPLLTQIEANVVRWFCEIVGYPPTARGFLTSGGSLANLSAVITAREIELGEDFSRGTIYISDQAHHCIAKAARLAGLPQRHVRILSTNASLVLDPDAVRAAIRADRAQGLAPFMLVASAGTTNAGVIDPLASLAALARDENLWFHVDGAYGGFFRMTNRGVRALAGIEQADSIVLDPHKTLFLPYGTGALLVRDGRHLKATHGSNADYLPPLQHDEELVDFCEISPELTRPFRGLRVWLPFKMHGAEAFREYLDEKLDLAAWVAERLAAQPGIELLVAPALSILAFAVRRAGSLEERNAATRALLGRINARQRVHLTGTMLHGVYAIRVAIGVFRTHAEHTQRLIEEIRAGLAEAERS